MRNGKKIILTGAGGAALPFVIKKLKSRGYKVYAADMDKNAVGFYFADKGFVIPKGISEEFFPALLDICLKEKVDAIIPLVDEELLKCFELQKYNISVILPRKEFVQTCLDKYVLMKRLAKMGISVPETKLASDGVFNLDFPIVAKPRCGRGSRGLAVLNSSGEVSRYLDNMQCKPDEIILQRYIRGTEFTVSVMAWRHGDVQAVVPKEVILKKGITRLAVTRKNSEIESLCSKIHKLLQADGPFNAQLILEEKSKKPYIFEINPRFSTSVSLTIEAGVDEIGEILDQELLGKVPKKSYKWKKDIVLIRHSSDYFVQEKEFNVSKKNIKIFIGKN